MSSGCVLYASPYIWYIHLNYYIRCMCRVWGNCIHIGVGFCVARSTKLGNARALISGMSNGYRLSRFFSYIMMY